MQQNLATRRSRFPTRTQGLAARKPVALRGVRPQKSRLKRKRWRSAEGSELVIAGLTGQSRKVWEQHVLNVSSPLQVRTMKDAARRGGSSAAAGMAATPSGARQAGSRYRRPGMARIPVMSSEGRAGTAARPSRPSPAMTWLQLAQSRPPPAPAPPDRPVSTPSQARRRTPAGRHRAGR